MRTRIIIFAKAPVPGEVKTRLASTIGAEAAARLAERMLADTCREVSKVRIAEAETCTSPEPDHVDWAGRLPDVAHLSAQGEGDLGERLARAARRTLEEGSRAVLIGTDCPDLTASRLQDACQALETHDAVIHPTFDGGYALLGLNRFAPSLFDGIGWSGPSVARDTIGRIGALGWSLHVGEVLRDIDEPEDLEHYQGTQTT